MLSCSVMSDSAILWIAARQAPLCMEFSSQEYWIGLPCPSPGNLPDPGMESRSPALKVDSLPLSRGICLHCGRPRFDPWIGKIPWRRAWQPTPVFLPGESHGQRNLVDYCLWGLKESYVTERPCTQAPTIFIS